MPPNRDTCGELSSPLADESGISASLCSYAEFLGNRHTRCWTDKGGHGEFEGFSREEGKFGSEMFGSKHAYEGVAEGGEELVVWCG